MTLYKFKVTSPVGYVYESISDHFDTAWDNIVSQLRFDPPECLDDFKALKSTFVESGRVIFHEGEVEYKEIGALH